MKDREIVCQFGGYFYIFLINYFSYIISNSKGDILWE